VNRILLVITVAASLDLPKTLENLDFCRLDLFVQLRRIGLKEHALSRNLPLRIWKIAGLIHEFSIRGSLAQAALASERSGSLPCRLFHFEQFGNYLVLGAKQAPDNRRPSPEDN